MNPAEDASTPSPSGPAFVVQSGGIKWTRVATPRTLSRIFKVVYVVCGLLAMIASLASASSFSPAGVGLSGLSTLFWPFIIVSIILSMSEKQAPGTISVERDSVAIAFAGARSRSVRRADIVGVLFVERAVGNFTVPTVELELANGDRFAVRLADMATAQALLESLGGGLSGARTRVRLALPSRRLLHPAVGLFSYWTSMILVGAGSAIAASAEWSIVVWTIAPVLTMALYAVLRPLVRAREVVIGADGIAVEKRFRRGMRLVSADRLLKAVGGALLLDQERLRAALNLAAARQSPFSAPPLAAERVASFGRGGVDVPTWRQRLHQVVQHGSYRNAASPISESEAVLRSPLASPEQRIGAALALRVSGEPAERIRVAAETVVDDRVREALEAVAADDDVAVERALRKL